MISNALIYAFAFVGIWIGSGLAIHSVEKLSKLLRISSFMVSFLILGLFTSMGELSVGVNSLLHRDPEIFVGNLIGASIVLSLLIVPLLAIVGKPIKIPNEFRGFTLPAALVTIALPVIVSMDGKVDQVDSIIVLTVFVILLLGIQSKQGFLERLKNIARPNVRVGKELLNVLFGVVIIFVASRFIVSQTLYFSNIFGIAPFLISLLVISLGTNVPELSLVFRSRFMKNNQVAFGDYIGSAVFNAFLFGALSLTYGEPIYLTNSYMVSLLFLVVGLFAFYFFSRTKHTISRAEGCFLLLLYGAFLATEIGVHKPLLQHIFTVLQ